MKFELVTPDKLFTSMEGVQHVACPGTEGDFGVLKGHMPLISTLRPGGAVRVRDGRGKEVAYTVHGGFVEVTPTSVTVLAERVE
jgi:F-type H+-transporting ATPase subunit epsilon